jgi:hypothetical protein
MAGKNWGFDTDSNTFTLSHYKNFQDELNLVKHQDRLHNGLNWKLLKSGEELKKDQNASFLVNVVEGGHALQGPYSMIELKNLRERDRDPRFRKIYNLNKMELSFIKAMNPNNYVSRKVDAINGTYPVTQGEKKSYASLPNEKSRKASPSLTKRESKRDVLNEKIKQTHELLDSLIKAEIVHNINQVKNDREFPLFMVTIAHLSWNGMVSHARALDTRGAPAIILKKFNRIKASDDQRVLNQWKDYFYSESEVNEIGKLMIKELLKEEPGRKRILIDLKHADYTARKYFYDKVMLPDPAGLAKGKVDTIPPICSHCAVTGLKEYYFSPFVDEYSLKKSSVDSTFYPFSLNLYDEEIARIARCNGIIGIPLEQRVLGGLMRLDRELGIKYKFEEFASDQAKFTEYFGKALAYNAEMGIPRDDTRKNKRILLQDYLSLEPFMQNLFYIIDHTGKQGPAAWKHVCIGSDLDGIIDPIDICPTASQYPYMRKRMEQFIPFFLALRREKDATARCFNSYFNDGGFPADNCPVSPPGFSMKNALDLLFYDSLRNFVIKNFH